MKKDIVTKIITYIIIFFIGIFFAPIKDNINAKFIQPKASLSVKARTAKIIDDEQLITNNTNKFNNYLELKNILNTTSRLYVYDIKIQNTGKKELDYKDFYPKETLRIYVDGYNFLGAYIDSATKNYINAKIDNIDNGNIYIRFDTLEPNDSIYIKILRSNYSSNIKLFGKTKSFDEIKPVDYETTKIVYTDSDTAIKLMPKSPVCYIYNILLVIMILYIIYLFIGSQIKDKIFNNKHDVEEVQGK